MKFGLIFFSSREAGGGGDKYRLVVECARYADRHGFSAIWIPERHFTQDGWLYPNPAVLQAALARETTRIGLRAGSVVLPLHDPIRVAEEWAMVDNLSGGRVAISFASGWHAGDFVFFPDKYADRHAEMYRGIETVQRLWQGGAIEMQGGDGKRVEVKVFPTPVQPELPIWLTAAGSPHTFARAGELGANLLTHLFNQSVEELAEKIRIYRESAARCGRPAGQVTLMLHTFIWPGGAAVRGEVARSAFCRYLKTASYLLGAVASSRGRGTDFANLSEADLDEYIQFVFDRLVSTGRALFGTPEDCADIVAKLAEIGVDELACQLDFGIDAEFVRDSLPHLDRLREMCDSASPAGSPGRAAATVTLDEIRARCAEQIAAPDSGGDLLRIGRVWRRDGEALAELASQGASQPAAAHEVHALLLDAALQILTAALPADGGAPSRLAGMRRFEVRRAPGQRCWGHALIQTNGVAAPDVWRADVRFLDEGGDVLAEILGLVIKWQGEAATPGSEPELLSRTAEAEEAPTRESLLAAEPEERQRMIEDYLRRTVARVLRAAAEKVDVHEPLPRLGLDSLMAVELKRRIEVNLGASLGIANFLIGHSIAHLAERLAAQFAAAPPTAAPAGLAVPEDLLERLDQLSDAEVQALLGEMLAAEKVKQ